MRNVIALILGVLFGVLLLKSEVSSWFRVQKMFRFEEPHMYLIIGSAIAVGAASVWIIKRWQVKAVGGETPTFKPKPFHKGLIFGGVLFGIGWATTGACPGPIYAQMGNGDLMAICSFCGAFAGAYLYAGLKPRLPS